MGMATATTVKTPEPRYKNTVVCERCHAEFDPTLHWVAGYSKGTSGDFHPVLDIGKNKCPICRKTLKSS